jgi:hypothetical protein
MAPKVRTAAIKQAKKPRRAIQFPKGTSERR